MLSIKHKFGFASKLRVIRTFLNASTFEWNQPYHSLAVRICVSSSASCRWRRRRPRRGWRSSTLSLEGVLAEVARFVLARGRLQSPGEGNYENITFLFGKIGNVPKTFGFEGSIGINNGRFPRSTKTLKDSGEEDVSVKKLTLWDSSNGQMEPIGQNHWYQLNGE